MPAAQIKVNGVPGSNTDVPINTIVQLDNTNIGGEVSYLWSILDQPPLTADNLSAVNIQNPTFTPKKEGSYYLRLIVNQGLPSEQEDRVLVAVRQLKTLERIPAAGETTEADSVRGWATANNAYLYRIDALLGDPGIYVGVNASGGVLTKGDVLRASTTSTIKAGLPGQEFLPGFSKALATTLGEVDEPLVVCEGTVAGAASVANGALMRVRFLGRYPGNVGGGAAAVGDAVYVTDTGTMSLVAGTVRRKVGSAMTAGATYDVWFAGVGGEDITPIDRGYLVYGNPGTLTNAHRVDGTSATPGASGGSSYLFKAADAATVPLKVRAGPASTQDLLDLENSAGSPILSVTDTGSLVWSAFTLRQFSATLFDLYFGAELVARVTKSTANALLSLSALTAGASSSMAFSTATTELVVGADSTGTRGFIGTEDASNLEFRTDATTWWTLGTTGNLTGAGTGQIKSVADPTAAQDAVTKNYTDVTYVAATHTWSALQTFSAGIVVTQSTLNATGTQSTGNGTGAGGTFIGGSSNGRGVNGQGVGTSPGGYFVGGATGDGLYAEGGGASKSGALLKGGAGGVGAFLENGTAATGATPQNALTLNNGYLGFGTTVSPNSTTGITNLLTPVNMAKAWATVTTNGAGGVTVNDGANIASASISGTDLAFTIADDFATANYVTIGSAVNSVQDIRVVSRLAGSTVLRAITPSTAATYDLSTNVLTIDVVWFGRQ